MNSLQVNGLEENWENDLRLWVKKRRHIDLTMSEYYVEFFQTAFERTYDPDRAWFGIHTSTVSLVVGGIFLASVVASGREKGIWLLLDQNPPKVVGWDYRPVKSTQSSKTPLTWGHAESFDEVVNVVNSSAIWESYAQATMKIFNSPRISSDRDEVQQQRGKRKLIDILSGITKNNFLPEEVSEANRFYEGSIRSITVNAYERNLKSRQECISHYGLDCQVCGINFAEKYGKVGEGFIHVHHLKPLSEIGEEYEIDPINDLCPVCPNCHAIIHKRRNLPYSIEEVRDFLNQQNRIWVRRYSGVT